MTPAPSTRFYAIAVMIVLCFVGMLVAYARLCLCDICKNPFAIFGVGDLQFCWHCWWPWRKHQRKIGRRRSLLRRIWSGTRAATLDLVLPRRVR